MPENSFLLKIRLGEIDNRTTVKKAFEGLTDGAYLVTIKKANRRSDNQNRYIHGVLFPEVRKALINAGYDDIRTNEDAKQVCKALFLKTDIPKPDGSGEFISRIKDTSELSKTEMMEFVDTVIKWAADNLGWEIPYPGEATTFNFHN